MANKTSKKATKKKSPKAAKNAAAKRVAARPALLAGGNPQIAKADGDAPVLGQCLTSRKRYAPAEPADIVPGTR